MLEDTAAWTFDSRKRLTQWYGHVHLFGDSVIGQWCCLNRTTGGLDWQRTLFRPNTFVDVDQDVIIATETRSEGPATICVGCYGISLNDGRLLWTSHASGWLGGFMRLLDFFPGFANEFRDTPSYVEEGEVFCYSGRVLDAVTGQTLRRIPTEVVQAKEKSRSVDVLLYQSGLERTHDPVKAEPGLYLRHSRRQEGWQRGALEITGESTTSDVIWTFSLEQLGRHSTSNFYAYRLVPPWIYLVVSEQPNLIPHPTKKHYALPNATRWSLVTLCIRTGQVLQDLPLGNQTYQECRIEDADEGGLLVSQNQKRLLYFRRT